MSFWTTVYISAVNIWYYYSLMFVDTHSLTVFVCVFEWRVICVWMHLFFLHVWCLFEHVCACICVHVCVRALVSGASARWVGRRSIWILMMLKMILRVLQPVILTQALHKSSYKPIVKSIPNCNLSAHPLYASRTPNSLNFRPNAIRPVG